MLAIVVTLEVSNSGTDVRLVQLANMLFIVVTLEVSNSGTDVRLVQLANMLVILFEPIFSFQYSRANPLWLIVVSNLEIVSLAAPSSLTLLAMRLLAESRSLLSWLIVEVCSEIVLLAVSRSSLRSSIVDAC